MYARENEEEVILELLGRLKDPVKVCVDIGAKSLANSNVAYLIKHLGWKGVLIDRGVKNFGVLMQEFDGLPICISHLTITPKNVNAVLPQKFDLLSIDIDGQDYHVWQAIKAAPAIVIVEFNPRLTGHKIMGHDDKYEWKKKKDYDNFGSSKDAVMKLGNSKGYECVGHNVNNLFFLREGAR